MDNQYERAYADVRSNRKSDIERGLAAIGELLQQPEYKFNQDLVFNRAYGHYRLMHYAEVERIFKGQTIVDDRIRTLYTLSQEKKHERQGLITKQNKVSQLSGITIIALLTVLLFKMT